MTGILIARDLEQWTWMWWDLGLGGACLRSSGLEGLERGLEQGSEQGEGEIWYR